MNETGVPGCTCRDAASVCGACLARGSQDDQRAERAILSHAEAYRLVTEALNQRTRAERAEIENAALRRVLRQVRGDLGLIALGRMRDQATAADVRRIKSAIARCDATLAEGQTA